ncbi:MAG: Brp/Blh family beta-carotene 15,15'-dioxygenase [Actinomycetota bacterium]|nr:Brp/Blh family beta-carotene 15,15'-dioxygenase [Actinomycetota bacterium]
MEAGCRVRTSPEVRLTFVRVFLLPSWTLLAGVALFFLVGVEVEGWVRYAPFALSLVFFGLPHGAVDHLVPGRLSDGGVPAGSITRVVILYLALGALYLGLWFAAPTLSFVFFIALTWFHWGQGDLYFLAALERGANSVPRALKGLTAFVRGGMPMLVPLLVFPEVYRGIAGSVVGLFRNDVAGLAWVFSPTFRGAAGAGFFLAVLANLYWRYRVSGRRYRLAWWLEVAETTLLAAYFATVPPVLALGLYFCLWHSPRHVARLMLLERGSAGALEKGRIAGAFAAFARDAAPLTVAALALLVGLYFLVPAGVEGATGLLAVYLVLISTLTLPHVVVVSLMDLRQGIWR